jgi:hypothetical protein
MLPGPRVRKLSPQMNVELVVGQQFLDGMCTDRLLSVTGGDIPGNPQLHLQHQEERRVASGNRYLAIYR